MINACFYSTACLAPPTDSHSGLCRNRMIKIPLKTTSCCAMLSLHCLPSVPNIRKELMNFIFPCHISKILVLCSLHFTADLFTNKALFDVGFSERLKLKDDGVRLYWIGNMVKLWFLTRTVGTWWKLMSQHGQYVHVYTYKTVMFKIDKQCVVT